MQLLSAPEMNSSQDVASPVRLLGPDQMSDALGSALRLMTLSSLHRRWTIGDVDRLILPPIELNQCLFAEKDGTLAGFVTWALFSEETSAAFINRLRPLRKQDWNSGAQLWIIDFIGPHGSVPQIALKIKEYLCDRYPEQNQASAIRYKDHGRVRRLSRWTR